MFDYGYVCLDCSVAGETATPGYLSTPESRHRGHDYDYYKISKNHRRMRQFIESVASNTDEWEETHTKQCPNCDRGLVTHSEQARVVVCPSCTYEIEVDDA